MKPKRSHPGVSLNLSRGQVVVCVVICLIALSGFGESIYLTVLSLTGEMAICSGSSDCYKVLGSPYSHIGPVPVAALGIAAYFTVFTLSTFSAFGLATARRFLPWVIGGMCLGTLWFLYVQAFILQAWCKYCLFSAALVLIMAGISLGTPAPRSS